MPAIHIRGLDDAVIAALKARAAQHNRSLQGEVKTILERAAAEAPAAGAPRQLRLKTVRTGRRTTFSRDEIYDDGGR